MNASSKAVADHVSDPTHSRRLGRLARLPREAARRFSCDMTLSIDGVDLTEAFQALRPWV